MTASHPSRLVKYMYESGDLGDCGGRHASLLGARDMREVRDG
jgi:hypothetical protein